MRCAMCHEMADESIWRRCFEVELFGLAEDLGR